MIAYNWSSREWPDTTYIGVLNLLKANTLFRTNWLSPTCNNNSNVMAYVIVRLWTSNIFCLAGYCDLNKSLCCDPELGSRVLNRLFSNIYRVFLNLPGRTNKVVTIVVGQNFLDLRPDWDEITALFECPVIPLSAITLGFAVLFGSLAG